MHHRSWISSSVLVALALVLTSHAQEPRQPAARRLLQSVAPPPIDRGLEQMIVTRARNSRSRARVQTPSRLPYEPGRVIVRFRSGTGSASRAQAMRVAGAASASQPPYANFQVLSVPTAADPEAVASQLRRNTNVEYAQAAYKVEPYFTPNDPLFDRQWNLAAALGMEQAWDINRGSSDEIIVAVLDTGVAYKDAIFEFVGQPFIDENGVSFPALGPVVVPFSAAPDLDGPNRFVAPRDFIWNDEDPVDLEGHGTHVAGTIGQLTDNDVGVAGVAFNVRIMPVKVISGAWDTVFDAPNIGTDAQIAAGIRYAVENGARVLNMSIGRNGPPAPVVEDALRDAVSSGAFVAIAAGNEFEEGNPDAPFAEIASRIDGVMAVSAVDRNLNRAAYSAIKPYVEIAAPGGDFDEGGVRGMILQQTYDPVRALVFPFPPSEYGAPRFDMFVYLYSEGTSMATAHVSGLAALLMQQGITSPAAIEAAITRFATDRGNDGRDDEYGHGLINPRATLRGLGILQ
ncbi:MAG: S8 family serine peptidase [Luteitalea sp.]|nr:S8 family serine peptidase [Luteitalea sp.]